MTIMVITSVMEVIATMVTTGGGGGGGGGGARVVPAIVISIVKGNIILAHRCVGWGLMIMAMIVRVGIVVSASMWVTPRAHGYSSS